MSGYVSVNNAETHCKSLNLNGAMHENKFVTNVHLGRITFSRPIADWDSLTSKHTNSSIKKSHCCLKLSCCSKQQWKSYSLYFIKSTFPCIDTLLHYNWRSDFLKDTSVGLAKGVMNIPQGMAYSLLAGLPPVYGLYIGFLSPLFYAIFGRCTQFSMGTFAVVSLLIVGPIEQHSSKVAVSHHNSIINSNSTLVEDIITNKLPLQYSEPRAIVAVTLTFLVGIIQLIIGFCRLGTFTSYLAPSMVSGYTSGAGFHVLSSQISSLFGVKSAKKDQGPGSLFMVYVNLFKNIRDSNLFTLLISVASIAFLMMIKFCAEPLLKRYIDLKIPIPSELILVALGTVISGTLNLHSTKNVSIVGYIASGMPQVTVPYWSIIPDLLPDAILIGFVSTFLSVSLVKLFSLKYRNKVNFNHEILSLGIINTFTSFFSCFVQSGSLSRSMVLAGTKTRTPLSGIFSSVLIVFVLLYLGPYFEATPSCILSAIIVVALKNILTQPKKLPYLWNTYKPDFFLFTVTFLGTLILDVTYGLLVGLISCLIVLTERQRSIKLLELCNISGTELYVHKHYELLTKTQIDQTQSDYLLSSIKAIRVLGSLNFSSAENFTERIYKTINNMMLDEDFNYVNNNVSIHHNTMNDTIQYEYRNHCQLSEVSMNTKDNKNNIYELAKNLDERNGTKSDVNYSLRNSNVVSKSSDILRSEKCNLAHRQTEANRPPLHVDLHDFLMRHGGAKLRRFLLLDISGITHIDPAGAAALTEIQRNLFKNNLYVILCGDPTPFKCLSTCDWNVCPGLKSIYPTLYDAGAVCVKLLCQDESNSRRSLESRINDTNSE
ncbi:unnamed protein product [Schistosoma rodhaini]|uniref:STAS domain-containing protein n=1 Tax=Schistosoma rodhaini TaxID=6188 RepID=A0AA85F6R4_9TREM|nr:unnamed protein product [Schistosoma rodhaini]